MTMPSGNGSAGTAGAGTATYKRHVWLLRLAARWILLSVMVGGCCFAPGVTAFVWADASDLVTPTRDIFTVPLSVAKMTQTQLWGLPLSVIYGLVVALAVGGVLRYLPVGRKLRAVGANPRAAALTGIQPGLYRIVTFTLAGTLAGLAGVVLTGQLGSATAAGSADGLLLPIFAAVFLGSTAFTPGRFNVAGLIVAALFLAFVSSGLVLIGAPAWESPLINGSALILAVAMSSWASRLRARRFRSQQLKQLALNDLEPAAPAEASGTE